MSDIVLRNCLLFDGLSAELQDGAEVIVRDGVIQEINQRSTRAVDARVIDVEGRFVMPGLIDAHFHAYGADLNIGRLDRMPVPLRALHARAILEGALSRGFTTVRDAGGADSSLVRATELGLIDGPRLFPAGLAISQTGGHGDFRDPDHEPACNCGYSGVLSTLADGPDEMRRVVRDQLRRGATQIKLFLSGGVLSPTDPIWMNGFTDEEIGAAVQEAARWRTYVMAHAHTAEAAIRCARLGVRSIEHGTLLTHEAIEAIRTSGTFVVPTLVPVATVTRVGSSMGLTASMLDKARQVERHAFESFERVSRAGIPTGFGSDLLGTLMDQQCQEFVLRREMSSALEILRSATSVNARLLGMEGRLGALVAGARADLIVLDGSPLQDVGILAQPGTVRLVLKDGRIARDRLLH
jgi:imidazolonepropionase-like amidohydrolase